MVFRKEDKKVKMKENRIKEADMANGRGKYMIK